MADVTELKCWPACLHALDWSPDCIIALASDEQVELLFPNTESYDSDRDVSQWRHLPLQVPWFTKEELPVKIPGPLQTYSIGEEISSSFTVHTSWSPPGLAKHRRCALAALTANLILSIWTSESKPQSLGSWGRRLIINDSLNEHFSVTGLDEVSNITEDPSEKIRLRRRIRTFAWAPSTAISAGIVGTQRSWGQHFMAVANDDNQVIIVAVKSPTSTFGAENVWSSDVVAVFSVTPASEDIARDPFDFEDNIQQQRSVSHLSWSPWITDGTSRTALLAYGTNEDVRVRPVIYNEGNYSVNVGKETVFPDIEIRFSGPMKWSPRAGRDGSQSLALFTNTEIVCLTVSGDNSSVVNRVTYPRDERWDMISGVAWDVNDKDKPRLHFCGHIMSTRNPTAALELSPGGMGTLNIEAWPYWRDQISGSEGHFSTSNDLKGHANSKVWGLSTSPLRDFMASCHTVHPTDMIEYGTPHDRRCTVAISHLWGKGAPLYLPPDAVSAEGVFFTVRRWIEYNIESPEELPTIKADIQRKLIQAYGSTDQDPAHGETGNDSSDPTTLDQLITTLKDRIVLHPQILNDRFEVLTSLICNPSERSDLSRTMIAFRLATNLQDLPYNSTSPPSTFSKTILSSIERVIHLVNTLTADDDDNDEEEGGPSTQPTPDPHPSSFHEPCIFCNADIPFQDLTSAICLNGHDFQRCGLSFLVIQGPRYAKYCGLCSTPFLSEEVVANGGKIHDDHNDDDDDEEEGGEEGEDNAMDVDIEIRTPHHDQEIEVIDPRETREGAVDNDDPRISQSTRTVSQRRMQKRKKKRKTTDSSGGGGDGDVGDGNLEQGHGGNDGVPDLARGLFLACDVCVYCGGKFVG